MEMYLDFIYGLPIVVQDPMAQKDCTHTDQKGVSDKTPRPSTPSPPEGGSAEPQAERSRLVPDGADIGGSYEKESHHLQDQAGRTAGQTQCAGATLEAPSPLG
jgi:hypothetical protein